MDIKENNEIEEIEISIDSKEALNSEELEISIDSEKALKSEVSLDSETLNEYIMYESEEELINEIRVLQDNIKANTTILSVCTFCIFLIAGMILARMAWGWFK